MASPSPWSPALRVLALGLALLVPLAACAPTASRGPFSLDDFINAKFTTRSFKGTWVADNTLRFFNSTTKEAVLYNLENQSTTVLVPREVLRKYTDSSIDSYSKDGRLAAIAYDTTKLYRHSTTSRFVIYDTQTGATSPVHGATPLRTLVWAGQHSIVWVQGSDVFYRKDAMTAGPDVQITTTGEDGIIFNGIPDWVYEEEVLASGSALWPSPDGRMLAFASFNDTFVNHTFYFKYGGESGQETPQYPTLVNITYPKAGTPNPDVHLMLVDLDKVAQTSTVDLIDILPPAEVTSDHILYGCFWTANRLLASWTNRVQNINIISSYDMNGQHQKQAWNLTEEAGWVDPPVLQMHSTGRRAAAILPKDDYPHLAVLTFADDDTADTAVSYLSKGDATVLSILGWDEARGHLYYVQTLPEDPAKRHVYRVEVPGEDNNQVASEPACLTCHIKSPERNDCTYGDGSFSTSFTYAALYCLGPDPAFYGLYRLQTASVPEHIMTWDDNSEVRALLWTRQRPEYIDEWYPVEGGFQARVRLMLPQGMDKSGATKYPLLVYVYAGPDSNQVTTAFSVAFGDYLCTNRKIIYALIDGRGSGRNGRKKMHALYRHLGTVEIQDQIAVADQVKNKWKFVDPARTAIWGWSYGGFSTAHAMAQDTGGVFCCGLSVAPVTSFIYYDTIYTERYMGLPTAEDNLGGYNGTDVTRRVDNFRNKKYMLIHGNADDNVHYQQSMELSRALEEKDIMFQQQSYPDEAHALAGVKKHVYHTMDDFWTRAFKLPKPDWANEL
ncbi:venom dipeptidyl peptidase 4-like isoform X2 [Thrips palmi]|uniref:Venom dipeptidyl peptidase 4 n=1 Tax=Thrips palmi TaxID=161013 RepID=A0A6P8YE88_THRPL|nr:venom dipeptidyl peptidase 4-like isoform X2 [Thrips palmi]